MHKRNKPQKAPLWIFPCCLVSLKSITVFVSSARAITQVLSGIQEELPTFHLLMHSKPRREELKTNFTISPLQRFHCSDIFLFFLIGCMWQELTTSRFVTIHFPEGPLHWFILEKDSSYPSTQAVSLQVSCIFLPAQNIFDANELTQRKTPPGKGSFGDIVSM